jgi:hypothetical protein
MKTENEHNISKYFVIEHSDNNENLVFNYKTYKLSYNNIKLAESSSHTIYESLKEIRYHISKQWFTKSYLKKKYNVYMEVCIDCIDYLIDKDYFEMTKLDKLLLIVIFNELNKIKSITI